MEASELFHVGLYRSKYNGETYVYNAMVGIFDGKMDFNSSTLNFEPIPLTPEILGEWFGAKYGSDEFRIALNYPEDLIWDKSFKLRFFHAGRGVLIDNAPEFVHQLQRLYHALTGQPLERIDKTTLNGKQL